MQVLVLIVQNTSKFEDLGVATSGVDVFPHHREFVRRGVFQLPAGPDVRPWPPAAPRRCGQFAECPAPAARQAWPPRSCRRIRSRSVRSSSWAAGRRARHVRSRHAEAVIEIDCAVVDVAHRDHRAACAQLRSPTVVPGSRVCRRANRVGPERVVRCAAARFRPGGGAGPRSGASGTACRRSSPTAASRHNRPAGRPRASTTSGCRPAARSRRRPAGRRPVREPRTGLRSESPISLSRAVPYICANRQIRITPHKPATSCLRPFQRQGADPIGVVEQQQLHRCSLTSHRRPAGAHPLL